MKSQTRIYSRKLPESIKNAISLDAIQVKNFTIFMEKLSLVVIFCFRQKDIFRKRGVFKGSTGRVHDRSSRGQAPGPPLLRASLMPLFSAPPTNMNFVPTGVIK